MKRNDKLIKLSETALFAALAVVFMLTVRFPILPGAAFLEYDMGDIPVIIAALLLGPVSGTATLFTVALIQSLTVSAASSWQGFLMHFCSSEIFILVLYALQKKAKSKKFMIFAFAVSTLLMTGVMIPLNLVFTPMYMKVPVESVIEMILPALLPFNLIKGIINSAVSFFLYFPVKKILEKSKLLPKKQ